MKHTIRILMHRLFISSIETPTIFILGCVHVHRPFIATDGFSFLMGLKLQFSDMLI
jgi:hypothetical protein